MRVLVLALSGALALAATSASAVTVHEIGDAGSTLTMAHLLEADTKRIRGTLGVDDEDLYHFKWTGGDLRINAKSDDFDTQLFLFDHNGAIVAGNDDGGRGLNSRLRGDLGAGYYTLAVTGYDNDPLNLRGADLENTIGNGSSRQYQPGTCATSIADCVLAGWSGGGEGGDYRVVFSAPVNPVPLPASAGMLAFALAGLGLVFRRRR